MSWNRTTEEPQSTVAEALLATHVLRIDVKALKKPVAHALHSGWVVALPAALVYLPGGHLVWAVQESGFMLCFEVKVLQKPCGHVSHLDCAV